MVMPEIQVRKRSPALVKEQLFVAGGIILVIISIIILFFSVLLGDIVYLIGALVSIIYTIKQYKTFKEHHLISKAGIIWQSIITWGFVIIGFIIILIVNLFWLAS